MENKKTLLTLQSRIYAQNKAMGWHDEERSFNTFLCLFHSELSEAMEGVRKNLFDDHLPHYLMISVEVADFVTRILDWFGTKEGMDIDQVVFIDDHDFDDMDYIAEMHELVSLSGLEFKTNQDKMLMKEYVTTLLSEAVMLAFAMARKNRWDLLQIIDEKLEYNKTRADHQKANRVKEGGKKF